jgi:hypothetical protein
MRASTSSLLALPTEPGTDVERLVSAPIVFCEDDFDGDFSFDGLDNLDDDEDEDFDDDDDDEDDDDEDDDDDMLFVEEEEEE